VGTVMRRGYRLGDQILRHALVGVVDTVEEPDVEAEQAAESTESAESEATAD